ncbi:DUF3501 family protein [Sneathiella limimaris]|uniref:DUF3501 family protein n=1 Tax=Sneathiella limimaris TaxID=1964213 RepID=UPI00146C0763|nr:DUF3501 family protein [Sneathiella limimaris]
MSAENRNITRSDILSIPEYEKIRKSNKEKLIGIKRDRRVHIGPFATFYFENYDTMWSQIHEMLYIERGGEEQIEDELAAYNPLIPNGREFVATFMIEIEDPVRRDRMLHSLGYIEDKIYMSIDGERSNAIPEDDVDRTTAEGKTSAIHFLHFPLSSTQMEAVKQKTCEIILGIDHQNYNHMTKLSDANREALLSDLAD